MRGGARVRGRENRACNYRVFSRLLPIFYDVPDSGKMLSAVVTEVASLVPFQIAPMAAFLLELRAELRGPRLGLSRRGIRGCTIRRFRFGVSSEPIREFSRMRHKPRSR